MMRTLLILSLMCATLGIAGCMTGAVVLRHPETGAIAKCGPYYIGGPASPQFGIAATVREENCVRDFVRQGYERVSDEKLLDVP